MPAGTAFAESLGIKSGVFHLRIAFVICGALVGGVLRGDGIALSRDGETWLPGAGAYGSGWGDVGEGLRVEAGSTVYVRYFATSEHASRLYYAAHGTRWGAWKEMGPDVGGALRPTRTNPVTLKLTNIGTKDCRVGWVNGDGVWIAITSPGVYDLGLHPEAQWTVPPLTIVAPDKRSWWAALFFPLRIDDYTRDPTVISLSDAGGTGVMLGMALVSVLLAKRIIRRRRSRRPPSEPEKG